jgi:orotate phosphoribosyltransferase
MSGEENRVARLFRLLSLIRERSYREGDFTLASGKKSTFYIDVKTTTLHPEGAWLVGHLIVAACRAEGLEFGGVGGLTLGADPIATAVSLAAREQGLHWPAFIVRKESKGHGTGKYIEGIENLDAQRPLLVLEDVVTTGGSGLQAVERLRSAGFRVEHVFAVVDRREGGEAAFSQANVRLHSLLTLPQVSSGRLDASP